MSTPIDAKVAFFANKGAVGRNVLVREIVDGIQSGCWAGEIAKLRAMGRGSPDYEKRKARLPSFMLSASTNGGRKAADVTAHTGLIQLDIDQVGEAAALDLRDRLGEDRHILAAWISPSGDGVKAAFGVPADLAGHKAAFEAVADYMREKHCVTIDPACSDVSRQCFVSHDPGLLLNEACQPLALASAQAEPDRGAGGEGSSKSLHAQSSILYTQRPFFIDWPRLVHFYKRNVLSHFPPPQPGQRNETLKELVPSLMSIVKEEFVLAFALEYYHQHAAIFFDYPLAKWEAEAARLVEGCLATYTARISRKESAAYERLFDPIQKAVFRICRSLAFYEEEPEFKPPLFCLSCNHLADRLGCRPRQAQATLRAFQKLGIIEEVQKGQRFDPKNRPPKGTRLKATTYRWLLAEAEMPDLPPCQS